MGENRIKMSFSTQIIHSLIGIAIMVIIAVLPIQWPADTITPIGQQILGVFIGTLYLWTTVDPLWSSLLSTAAVGFTSYSTMSGILQTWFGNSMVVQMFFIMIALGALTSENVTLYIGRFFLTRKMINGRPWIFTSVILLGSFLMSAFINWFIPICLFWPVMYGIYDQVGYTKNDKYPKLMTILIVIASLIGFPVAPFMQNGLVLLSNYRTISEDPTFINNGSYFIACFVLGLIFLAVIILFVKYFYKPDVTPLKNITIDQINKQPLPPMNLRQKFLLISFFIYIVLMLIPCLFQNIPVMAWLNNHSAGFCLVYVAVLAALNLSDGKPVLQIEKVMKENFAWSPFFFCTTAIMLGSVLTNESTGITALLSNVLAPLFTGMSPLVFSLVLMLVAFVLTNICNSMVIGMLLQPIVLTYATTTGTNAEPIVTMLIFFVLLSACITPAASPFAALMFGNKEWLKSSEVYKYCGSIAAVELILMCTVGIFFMNLIV